MTTTPHGWNEFDPRAPLLTYAYRIGPGLAAALAVGGTDGLVIVSPPRRATNGIFEDLSTYGPVRALVASNAFHFLGLPEWKARFPDARVFAPAQSIARVERKLKLHGIEPLADAANLVGDTLQLVDLPYYRTGEALVRIDTGRGRVWYLTDLILNLRELPANAVVKILFRLSGSAPGLKFNNVAGLFMIRNRAAPHQWLAEEFRKAPPDWLIPAHGEFVDVGVQADAVRALISA